MSTQNGWPRRCGRRRLTQPRPAGPRRWAAVRCRLPTTLVAITPEGIDAETLARRLRLHEPPVFARIQSEQVLLDPRTLRAGDDGILVETVASTSRQVHSERRLPSGSPGILQDKSDKQDP